MKILVTSDFYSEYEIYETNCIDDLKAWIKATLNGENKLLDNNKHKLIGSHDTICTDDAIKQADMTIYVSDLIS